MGLEVVGGWCSEPPINVEAQFKQGEIRHEDRIACAGRDELIGHFKAKCGLGLLLSSTVV
jgi:hypothetical protein